MLIQFDTPTAAEIEAYYLDDKAHSSLSPERFDEVERYVKVNYLDGGTRERFIAQRRKIEAEIIATLD